MALRRFELDDLLTRPGTYFNPTTEVLVVVDDSADIDNEIFGDEDFEGDDWVHLSDETPLDETAREDVIEQFQTLNTPGVTSAVPADMDDEDELDEIEPDEDEDLGVEELDPESEGF